MPENATRKQRRRRRRRRRIIDLNNHSLSSVLKEGHGKRRQ